MDSKPLSAEEASVRLKEQLKDWWFLLQERKFEAAFKISEDILVSAIAIRRATLIELDKNADPAAKNG